MNKRVIFKYLLIFLFIFLVSISLQKIFRINLNELQKWIASFGILAPAVYSAMLFLGLSIPFNPIPDYLLVNLAALLFSPVVAILSTFVAHSLAISISFILARMIGWKVLDSISDKNDDRYIHKLAKEITVKKVFAMRWILPITAIGIDIVSYAAGLSKISFGKFYLASIIPWTVLSVIFFTSTNFVREKSSLLFFAPGLVLAVVSFSIFYFSKNDK